MDKLFKCADAYHSLMDITYRIILGRKGKQAELRIVFGAVSFHHLVGLHKLHDLRIARANREKVFYDILAGKITYDFIAKSRHFSQIKNRFAPITDIEKIFDSNRIVFRYNAKLDQFSLIEADYLLSTPYDDNDVYIFLAEDKGSGNYYCRSFFPKEQKDYTDGHALWTMLYKEKIHLSTGEKEIQYDRLTPKESTKKEESREND